MAGGCDRWGGIGWVATCGFEEGPRVARRASRLHIDSPSIPHSYLRDSRSPVSHPHSGVPNRTHASGFTAASRVVTIPIVFMGPYRPGMKSSPIPAFPLWGRGATGRKSQPATGIHASMFNSMFNAQSVPRQHIAVFGGVANPWPSDDGLWGNPGRGLWASSHEALADTGRIRPVLRERPPCRRCGQSHWPPLTVPLSSLP
jgi:hypothetical protein